MPSMPSTSGAELLNQVQGFHVIAEGIAAVVYSPLHGDTGVVYRVVESKKLLASKELFDDDEGLDEAAVVQQHLRAEWAGALVLQYLHGRCPSTVAEGKLVAVISFGGMDLDTKDMSTTRKLRGLVVKCKAKNSTLATFETNPAAIERLYYAGTQMEQARPDWTDFKVAQALAERLFECVKNCHLFGVAHGDLKLHNMMYDDDGGFKTIQLIDFGECSVSIEVAQMLGFQDDKLSKGQNAESFAPNKGSGTFEIAKKNDWRSVADLLLHLFFNEGHGTLFNPKEKRMKCVLKNVHQNPDADPSLECNAKYGETWVHWKRQLSHMVFSGIPYAETSRPTPSPRGRRSQRRRRS